MRTLIIRRFARSYLSAILCCFARFLLVGSILLGAISTARSEVDFDGNEYVIFYHHDALGNALVATDADGDVLWYDQVEPYGKSRGRVTRTGQQFGADPFYEDAGRSRLGFTGHVRDGASGLVYMQARHYDPGLGRFLSNDPVGFDPGNPVSFNRYAYANNNPYRYVDPDGRYATDYFSEEEIEEYMSDPLDHAIETGQVGGDAVAVSRLTYDEGKSHWQTGGGADMLVTDPLKVIPTSRPYGCEGDSGSSCQTGVVANPEDYAGSGQVQVKGRGRGARIVEELYDFDQKEVPPFASSPAGHVWNRVRNYGTRLGADDHGVGTPFEVHYSAPPIGWIGGR